MLCSVVACRPVALCRVTHVVYCAELWWLALVVMRLLVGSVGGWSAGSCGGFDCVVLLGVCGRGGVLVVVSWWWCWW